MYLANSQSYLHLIEYTAGVTYKIWCNAPDTVSFTYKILYDDLGLSKSYL